MSVLDPLFEESPNLERLVDAFRGTEDSLSIDEVAIRMLLAAVIGYLIGQVYRRTFTGQRFSRTLPDTHMLLCLGGAMIWLVVGNNLVRAFGLAGTIGLIRYRTVVRDPKDTTILLFSMIMGMACGIGQIPVALVGTVFVLLVLIFLHFTHRREMVKRSEKSKDLLNLLGVQEERPKKKRKKPKKGEDYEPEDD